MRGPDPTRAAVAIGAIIAAVAVAAVRPGGPLIALILIAVFLTVALITVTGGAATPPPVPLTLTPESPDPSMQQRWKTAAQRHGDVLSAYAAYELDPAMFLRFPALWDLTAPAVIDFHDALDLAGGLATDDYPGDGPAGEYVAAVSMLRTAWAGADRYARSTGTSALPSTDADACRRALKLLSHADGTSGPERATYLEQVIATVDGLGERGVASAPKQLQEDLRAQVRRAIGE